MITRSKGVRFKSISIAAIVLDFIAPVIAGQAIFLNPAYLSFSSFCMALDHHTKAPYSMDGLITLVRNKCTILGLRPHFVATYASNNSKGGVRFINYFLQMMVPVELGV